MNPIKPAALAIALIGTAFALIEYFIRDSQPAKSAAPQEEEGI